MTRPVVAGMSSNALTSSAWRRPVCGRHGDRRPHARVELAAELLDEALGVLGDLEVALGDQLLAVPGTHAQELHRRPIMPEGRWPAASRASSGAPGQLEDVHRPGPRAEVAQPVADRLAGDPPGGPRGLERRVAEREVGGERRRVRAARAVRGAVRDGARRGSAHASPVEHDVGRLLAVAAGHDHHGGPERVQRAARGPRGRRRVRRPSTRASGTFGVITVARGSSSRDERRAGRLVQQHGARLGDHHRVEHDRRAAARAGPAPRGRRRPSRRSRASRSSPRRRRCRPRRPAPARR